MIELFLFLAALIFVEEGRMEPAMVCIGGLALIGAAYAFRRRA